MFLKIPGQLLSGHMLVPAREAATWGGLQKDHLLPTMGEGQQLFWKIKGGKARTPPVHPGSLPVPEHRDPSELPGDGGWETDGRTRGEGRQRD